MLTVTENLRIKFIHDRVMGTRKYRNMVQGTRRITKEMGIGGLYRGLWLQIMRETASNGVRFPVFSLAQGYLGKFVDWQVPRDLLAGAAAGVLSVALNNPIDVVKSNM